MRYLPTAVRTLITTADQLKVALPKTARADLIHALDVIDKATSMNDLSSDVPAAVFNALDAGNDPTSDPEVIAAAVRAQIGNQAVYSQVIDRASVNLVDTVRLHIDGIFDTFKPAYDKAGVQLEEAHAILTSHGIDSLDRTDQIATAGLDVARANLQAREATVLLDQITNPLTQLLVASELTPGSYLGLAFTTVDTGDAPAVAVRQSMGHKTKLSPWAALSAGYTLSLANTGAVIERVRHANDIQALAQSQQEQEQREAAAGKYRS